jgi:intracellular septation protein A
MLSSKAALLLVVLLLPTRAWAHGEAVLAPFVLQLASLALFFVAITTSKLAPAAKAVVVATYLLTTLGVWLVTTWLPFQQSLGLINCLIGAGPIAGALAAYALVKSRFTKPGS